MSETRVVNIRVEPCDVNCMRPGPWGNPFIIGRDGDRAAVVAKHRQRLIDHPELIKKAKKELRGKRLGCVCAPLPCHCDNWADAAEGRLDQCYKTPLGRFVFKTPYAVRYIDPLGNPVFQTFPLAQPGELADVKAAVQRGIKEFGWTRVAIIDLNKSTLRNP